MSKLKVCLWKGIHFSRLISRALLSFIMGIHTIGIFIIRMVKIVFFQQFNIHLFVSNTLKDTWMLVSLTYIRTGHTSTVHSLFSTSSSKSAHIPLPEPQMAFFFSHSEKHTKSKKCKKPKNPNSLHRSGRLWMICYLPNFISYPSLTCSFILAQPCWLSYCSFTQETHTQLKSLYPLSLRPEMLFPELFHWLVPSLAFAYLLE